MSKTLKYVKEFDFGPQLTYVKSYARGGKCKTGYGEGGAADIKQDKAMVKSAVHKHEKSMHGGKPLTKLARGGACYDEGGSVSSEEMKKAVGSALTGAEKAMLKRAMEKMEAMRTLGAEMTESEKKMLEKGMSPKMAKGGKTPSMKATMKRESMRTPGMRSEEMLQRETVRTGARGPSAGPGMRPARGPLGIIANKNPGMRRGVPVAPDLPMISPMKKGGLTKAGMGKMKKVMGEFKRGDLHSGSSKGPKVTSSKQAVAIALSEARRKK